MQFFSQSFAGWALIIGLVVLAIAVIVALNPRPRTIDPNESYKNYTPPKK